jgi:putative phosphoesterase
MSAAKNQTSNGNESYCSFGFDVLSKLLKGLENQIEGVIENKDVECVHKMRVSTRKIRAVMPIFQSCYPSKKYKRWLTEIKAATKLLSKARDLDVQILFLQNYIHQSSEHQGLSPLLKDHKDQRKSIQSTVTDSLEKLKRSDVLTELSVFLKQNMSKDVQGFATLPVLQKTCWNITCLLDDLLVSSEYVHQESATLKHHEMRIKAKRLRYTMATFAPLYKNSLKQEIQLMKDFQDLLGEMHDCDVWLSYLSRFKDASEENEKKPVKKDLKTPEFKKAVVEFSVYVSKRKKSYYDSFVQLWDKAVEQDFFGALQKNVNDAAGRTQKIDAPLLSSLTKVAVLSDIHANLHALETVIEDANERGAQLFLNAGDSVGFDAFPNEVINCLYQKNMINVSGNFDSAIFKDSTKGNTAKKVAVDFAKKELTKQCKSYLNSFPTEVTIEMGGKKVLMTHASPKSQTEHLTHDTPTARLKQISADTAADLIIVGHSHDQFHKQIDGVSFVNPGSVGHPGDGNPQTAYAMLNFNPFKVDLIRLNYPIEEEATALRKKGLPESFAQMLLRGEPLENILKQDKAKKENADRDWNEITKISKDFSRTYLQDAHSEHVRLLALNIFDNLHSLHRLGGYERHLLGCAALLHDVGLSKGVKGHNKSSMTMILNETKLPFTSEERRIVASIARYHRRGLPKQKHYNLATLNSKTVSVVSALSSILRIADALDYMHNSDVNILSVKLVPKRVTFACSSKSDTSLVEQAFDKKKDLFEKYFKKKAMLTWSQQ